MARGSYTWVAIPFVAWLCQAYKADSTQFSVVRELDLLAENFQGKYMNMKYPLQKMMGYGIYSNYLVLRSEFYKSPSPLFNDSLTIYFQDFDGSSYVPFRTGFFSFTGDAGSRGIRMKTFIPGPWAFDFSYSELQRVQGYVIPRSLLPWEDLELRDFHFSGQCDMVWRRGPRDTLVGVTAPGCLDTLGHSEGAINATLDPDKGELMYTETWYNVKDGLQTSKVKVPSILIRLAGAKNYRHAPSTPTAPTPMLRLRPRGGGGKPRHKHSGRSKRVKVKVQGLGGHQRGRGRQAPKGIQSFHHLTNALTAGRDLHFRVNLTACKWTDPVLLRRRFFGGKISQFVWVRGQRARREHVYFSTHSAAISSEGQQYLTREVTVFQTGRVNVNIRISYHDPRLETQRHKCTCKLYTPRKRNGAVRIFEEQKQRVRQPTGFKALTSAAEHGKDLRFVIDLMKCHDIEHGQRMDSLVGRGLIGPGSESEYPIVIGSQIAGYDITNKGDAMEVFLKMEEPISTIAVTSHHMLRGYSAQVFKDGQVDLTRIENDFFGPGGRNRRLPFNVFYRCSFRSKNVAKKSVHVFYGV